MTHAPKPFLTDDDIRYEFRVMKRWCRMFRKTDLEWVQLSAKRFRDRHPLIEFKRADVRAA